MIKRHDYLSSVWSRNTRVPFAACMQAKGFCNQQTLEHHVNKSSHIKKVSVKVINCKSISCTENGHLIMSAPFDLLFQNVFKQIKKIIMSSRIFMNCFNVH